MEVRATDHAWVDTCIAARAGMTGPDGFVTASVAPGRRHLPLNGVENALPLHRVFVGRE